MYLTRDTALIYRSGPWKGPNDVIFAPLELCIFVDASFAQESGRHSQTGYALMMSGAAIHTKSGKQTQVTDSTAYAETIALHEAANWAVMVRQHLAKMFAPQHRPTKLWEDNQAAKVFFDKGPGPRSLHWDVKLHYVHELRNRGAVDVLHIDTKMQIADVLTKPLAEDAHRYLSSLLLGGPILFTD